jgi:molybdopterin-guanine dinucleotide biosynthesis protein A
MTVDPRVGATRPYDGVVLAGGAGRRLGGPDKPWTVVGGRPLIEVARSALAGAGRTIVVGPGQDCVEDPPGGGPVAALSAGLDRITQPYVVVLAADLPFVTAAAVEALVAAAPAVALDDEGREQWLVGAWPTAQLRAAAPVAPAGARLGRTLAGLQPQRLVLPGWPPVWWDCDTLEQLERARRWT